MNCTHNTNRLQTASLLRWVTIAAFLTVTGLGYLYLKNQLNVSGAERKSLENELRDLISQNNVMDAQISKLTALASVQRRVEEGFVKLTPIDRLSVVMIRPADVNRWQAVDHLVSDESQLRTVSREGAPTR